MIPGERVGSPIVSRGHPGEVRLLPSLLDPVRKNPTIRYGGFSDEEYARSRETYQQNLRLRFESALGKNWRDEGDCRIWTGRTGSNGYGVINQPGSSRPSYVHRVLWERAYGPTPAGSELLHSCDRPLCGNLGHLRLDTHQENVRDMYRRSRHSWAKLTPEQVRVVRGSHENLDALAEQFSVHRDTIRNIRRGRSWKYL